jgi:hypothetical protein
LDFFLTGFTGLTRFNFPIFSFHLPAIASRHVRHRLRLRQCRAGSGEAGGDETENTQSPSANKISKFPP